MNIMPDNFLFCVRKFHNKSQRTYNHEETIKYSHDVPLLGEMGPCLENLEKEQTTKNNFQSGTSRDKLHFIIFRCKNDIQNR